MEKGFVLKKSIIHEFRYYIFALLWSVYYVTIFLGNTAWFVLNQTPTMSNYIRIVRYIIYICLAILIFSRNNIRIKLLIRVTLAAIIIGIQSLVIDSNILVALLLFAIAASEFNVNEILKCSIFIESVSLIATIASSYLVSGLSISVYEADRSVLRNLLGFSWAFHGPNLFLFVYLQYVYIRKNEIKIKEMLFFEILSGILLYLSKARTPFIIMTGITIVVLFLKYIRVRNKRGILRRLIKHLPFAAFVFSFFVALIYNDSSKWTSINTLFHNRIRLAHNALIKYGIHLFGQDITWIGSQHLTGTWFEYNFVDNSYIQILVKFGVLVLMFTLIVYYTMIKNAVTVNDKYLVLILVFIIIYGIINPCLLDLTMNPFVLLIFIKEINPYQKMQIEKHHSHRHIYTMGQHSIV